MTCGSLPAMLRFAATPTSSSPPFPSACRPIKSVSSRATRAPRSGNRSPCSRSGRLGFQFLFAGFRKTSNITSKRARCIRKHFNIRVVDLARREADSRHLPLSRPGPACRTFPRSMAAIFAPSRAPTPSWKSPRTARCATASSCSITTSRSSSPAARAMSTKAPFTWIRTASITSPPSIRAQPVRLSDDYFIEASKANPPEVAIDRPGRDYRASPIEEVTVSVKAAGDFGLNDFALHYSVNGGPEKTVDLLKQKGVKQADGSTTLSLEDFKLVPGDLVSVYATAKDAQVRIAHRHVLHPGRSFRARILAVAADGRRWRRGRRHGWRPERNLPARKGNHRRHLEAAERQDGHSRKRPPRPRSFSRRCSPSCATRRFRSPAA